MTEFFKTRMGAQFYQGTMPRIASVLEDLRDELKRANDLKEKELGGKPEQEEEDDGRED